MFAGKKILVEHLKSIGIASTFRLIGAASHFVGSICGVITDWAVIFGDPEIPPPIVLVIVALFASGRYSQGALCLVIFAIVEPYGDSSQ